MTHILVVLAPYFYYIGKCDHMDITLEQPTYLESQGFKTIANNIVGECHKVAMP